MSINPIDVMRTQEVSQIKHIENSRIQHTQEQISRNFQTMIEHDHIKPKETTKSDDPEYRYDAKEKGKNQYFGSGNNKKEKKEEKKDAGKPTKSGGFDIRI
jgi:general stress protein YciG